MKNKFKFKCKRLTFFFKGKRFGIRYGAWYLGKEHWQKMPANEKLIDPKVKNDIKKIEARKKYEDIVLIVFLFF